GFGLGVAIGALFSGVLVGFGFAVPFVAATALGAVGLLLVYTQVGETVEVGGGGGGSPSPARGD
ncbi:MFS transporter, partial [Haloarcula sp. Atlit-7R]